MSEGIWIGLQLDYDIAHARDSLGKTLAKLNCGAAVERATFVGGSKLMSKIYLVNVGANVTHQTRARSPLFGDGTFRYVPFPCGATFEHGARPYADEIRPFVRNWIHAHPDPDWTQLTYGDFCANPKASNLRAAEPDDVFLFLSLLWNNRSRNWDGFSNNLNDRHWCFIGALRIQEVYRPDQRLADVPVALVERVRPNIHFRKGRLDDDNFVFVGNLEHSALFERAVDVGNGDLLRRTIFRTDGSEFSLDLSLGECVSALRTCRAVWHLENLAERNRAEIVRDAIERVTRFDFLLGL